MQRRNARLRRDYLFRKSNESKEKLILERKQTIKNAIKAGTQIPGELRKEAEEIRKQLHVDEHITDHSTHIDDEYANAGVKDPKILITTSRDPSSRLQIFSKEMRLIFPNSQRINRGGYVTKEIVEACKQNDVTDLIILHEHRGQPDGMVVCHFPYGPTAYFTLHNVVLRHDIPDKGTVSEQFPHLIFNNFQSKLGLRLQNILKYLFPVPKEDSKRTLTFSNENDFISFRHHVFNKQGKQIDLMEVGPRFEMQAYEIKLGTVDIAEADTEWVFRPYHRTAKKREFL
ncbi:snoRNA-binding rRNA-processing protein imp4 [Clydaea vesicula]|uniref:U3 small nucleolar ribonucleoprotein protein IMP4 n=1 Tax=Clydaea vesicula TaxID=447962 RepID=A0AAD5XVF6_9FUNG|nr:snoRNA-binding rRNA-processing protein imp4 [Clydaea vesicula]KAJ3385800.1 snoRNA-binding rRNA-processing protein imp4 [Lobulomyces angularis]